MMQGLQGGKYALDANVPAESWHSLCILDMAHTF